MRPIARGIAVLVTSFALAACSGGGAATPAPATPGTTTPAPATDAPATAAPATQAPVITASAAVCSDTTDATVVETSVGGFAWSSVTAKVGEVVTWTNGDSVPHKLAFDDGTCTMGGNIPGGGTRSLVFSKAGTYAFHCTIHGQMPGEITITP